MPINVQKVTVSTATSGLKTDPYPATPGTVALRDPLPGEPAYIDKQLDADIEAVAAKLNELIDALADAGADLTGATSLGKALVAAATPQAARDVIGAGTSNLVLGASSTNAAPGDHTHSASQVNDFRDSVRGVMPNVRTATASFVLGLNDDYVAVDSSSPLTVTVPASSSVAFPVGFSVTIRRVGTGGVSIVAGSGVTVRGALTGVPQNGSYSLIKVATNTWDAEGGL